MLWLVVINFVLKFHLWLRGRSSVMNFETREMVAIKKIANAFDNNMDAKRTLREIKLLRHLDHENVISIHLFRFRCVYLTEFGNSGANLLRCIDGHHTQIVGLRDVIPPAIPQSFNDVYIATELMDTDLHHIIRSNQELSEEHCQVARRREGHHILNEQK